MPANIPDHYLARDFERARQWWGHLIDPAERAHGIPARLLYAIYSRETNMGRHWDYSPPPATWPPHPTNDGLTYWIRNAGDEGNGRGIGQVDKRYHPAPLDWPTNIEWQVRRSAEILGDYLGRENGDVVRGANRYNSGQPLTSKTTGKDYGPDVLERWHFILSRYPVEAEPPPDPWAGLFVPILVETCG